MRLLLKKIALSIIFIAITTNYHLSYADFSFWKSQYKEPNKARTIKKVQLINHKEGESVSSNSSAEVNKDNDLIITLLNRMEAMQQELLELKGLVEINTFKLNKLKPVSSSVTLNEEFNKSSSLIKDTVNNKSESLFADLDPLEQEQKLYNKAKEFIKRNDLASAEECLTNISETFPEGALIAHVYYWLGEIYLNSDRINEAQFAFGAVAHNHPRHERAAESLLKLGMVEGSLGKLAKANELLKEVGNRYPGTPAARVAAVKLRQISSK